MEFILIRTIQIIAIVILVVGKAKSQDADSVKTYNLEEITVNSGLVLEPKSIHEIELNQIRKSDAGSIVELGKFIPSVKTQINSRGESQFFLRGSGERQLMLFFDGVPLNIPWDNRIDLSLVPTDAVGSVSVTKGIPSVVYGANTLAGVINISSKKFTGEMSKLSAQIGEKGFQNYSGYWLNGNEKISCLISASYRNRNSYKLSDSFSNPENPGDERKNSYLNSFSTYGKVSYNYNEVSKLSLSVNYMDAEKGVPPEIDVDSPRYWKYPLWKKYGLSVNGSHMIDKSTKSVLSYSVSAYKFKMQIDQYEEDTYSLIDDIEKDDDEVFYGRIIYTKLLGYSSLLKFSASALHTIHKEKFLSSDYIEQTYSQNIFSTGFEHEYIRPNFTLISGVSLDASNTPQTGEKPSKESIVDYSINTAFVYYFSDNFTAQLNLGRKTRFPTLRESFSGALGRFIINPELKDEVAYSGEFGISFINSESRFNINLFFTNLYDGIVRKVVASDFGSKFKRVNEDEIRTIGGELDTYFNAGKYLKLNFHFTYLNSFAKNSNGEFIDTLEYKPQLISGLNLDYSLTSKLNFIAELNYVGKEYGLQEGNMYFKELPNYFLLNARLTYLFEFNNRRKLNTFVRINNLLDKLYFTQWGLPEAGRHIILGASLEF